MKTAILILILTASAIAQAKNTNICDRSESVINAILIQISAKDCSRVTEEGLKQITVLNVTRYHESRQDFTFKTNDFSGLTNLRNLRIYLYDNIIFHFPTGLLRDQIFLETLIINDASYWPYGTYHIPDDILSYSNSLENVSLVSEKLPASLLESKTLKRLNVSIREKLSQGSFQKLMALEQLSLKFDNCAAIPNDLFRGLTNLRKLTLINGDFSLLERGSFQGLEKLDEIRVSSEYGSKCKPKPYVFSAETLEPLHSLRNFVLDDIDFMGFAKSQLAILKNLEFLSWRVNQNAYFSEDLFDENKFLKKVGPLSNDPKNDKNPSVQALLAKYPWLFENHHKFKSNLSPIQSRNGQILFVGNYKAKIDYYCDGSRTSTNNLYLFDNGTLSMIEHGLWRIDDNGKFDGLWGQKYMDGTISADGKTIKGQYARGCFEATYIEP